MINYFGVLFLGISLLSLIVSLGVLWSLRGVNKLRQNFLGSNLDLEQILNAVNENSRALEQRLELTERGLGTLDAESKFAIQKIGMVRFNPFGDSGGNFSFSLAILNARKTGIVVTSMHGRQQNRIYAKRIEQGISETQLTDEEQKAIDLANKQN